MATKVHLAAHRLVTVLDHPAAGSPMAALAAAPEFADGRAVVDRDGRMG